jgi:hypothetical protein
MEARSPDEQTGLIVPDGVVEVSARWNFATDWRTNSDNPGSSGSAEAQGATTVEGGQDWL